MNEMVQEWIAKAEGDYLTAGREVCANPPNYDAVCFYAQQCIEKLLKAILIAEGKMPPRTHDLTVSDSMLRSVQPDWHWPIESLRLLSQAAITFRYPGESAIKAGRLMIQEINGRIRRECSFTFETTLSGRRYKRLSPNGNH